MVGILNYAGQLDMFEVNPFDFTPGDHTLTLIVTDERGGMETVEFNFTSQVREGEQKFSC